MTCFHEYYEEVVEGFSKCKSCGVIMIHGEATIGGDGYGGRCAGEADVETISPIDPEELCVMIAELREERNG